MWTAVLFCLCVWGLAEEGSGEVYTDTLTIDVTTDPSQMAAPTETTVLIRLTNDQLLPVSDVEILSSAGEVLARAERLDEEESALEYTGKVTPSEDQLNMGSIPYRLRYVLGKGLPGEQTVERSMFAALDKLEAHPDVQFTRTLPAGRVQAGSEIEIAYQVHNTGNVDLSDLSIWDGNLGYAAQGETLRAGERRTFVVRQTLRSALISQPFLSCRVAGTAETLERSLAASIVRIASGQWTLSLSASSSSVAVGESLTLTCRIRNASGARGKKLRMRDAQLGEMILQPDELSSGRTVVFTRSVILSRTTTFLFTLEGETEGGTVAAASNPLTVAVGEAPHAGGLTLSARASDTEGGVRLLLRNSGSKAIRGVHISEASLGEIRTLAVVAPGETDMDIPVKAQNRPLVFRAEYADGMGGETVVLAPALTLKKRGASAGTGQESELDALAGRQALQIELDGHIYGRMMVEVSTLLAVLIALGIWRSVTGRKRVKRTRTPHERLFRHILHSSVKKEKGEEASGADKAPPNSPFVRTPGTLRGEEASEAKESMESKESAPKQAETPPEPKDSGGSANPAASAFEPPSEPPVPEEVQPEENAKPAAADADSAKEPDSPETDPESEAPILSLWTGARTLPGAWHTKRG